MAVENKQESDAQSGINLSDLALVVQIVDACTKRGAFEGSELATVGQLRNKVEAFGKANTPPEEKAEETTTE